jgi:hypothetical protein
VALGGLQSPNSQDTFSVLKIPAYLGVGGEALREAMRQTLRSDEPHRREEGADAARITGEQGREKGKNRPAEMTPPAGAGAQPPKSLRLGTFAPWRWFKRKLTQTIELPRARGLPMLGMGSDGSRTPLDAESFIYKRIAQGL